MKLLRIRLKEQSGVVAIVIALLLPVLIGMLGLVLDLGFVFHYKRTMQTATDAGAFAGAIAILREEDSQLNTKVLYDAAKNGFDGSHGETRTINRPELWNRHDIGLIDKNQIRRKRFPAIFDHFGSNNQTTAEVMSREFLEVCPKKGHIFPFVIDVLQYLKDKYALHVITNGFKDMQAVKMKTSGIDHFFQQIIISEEVGYKKPQTEIFNFALAKAGAGNYEAVMIGDNLIVDIAGARNARIDQVFFNPKRKPFNDLVTYHINCHSELKGIF